MMTAIVVIQVVVLTGQECLRECIGFGRFGGGKEQKVGRRMRAGSRGRLCSRRCGPRVVVTGSRRTSVARHGDEGA